MNDMQTMSHESSGLCWCGPNNHGPERKTMADVLTNHPDWQWSVSANSVGCTGCGWSLRIGPDDRAADYFRDHQANALAAEGYGSIRQAQEVAWAKGAMAAGMNLFVLQDAGINPNPYREDPK